MSYKVGFLMDHIAGHITNYLNLRSVAERDPELQATWHEIHYYKGGGSIEWLRERAFTFVPSYATGILRGTWEIHKALRHGGYDALFSNTSVGALFSRRFRRVPTLMDFDSTPRQIDRMKVYNSPVDAEPVANLKWRLSRNLMRSAALLQAWSRWAKQSAVDDYGISADTIVVNPPGVDLDYWRPDQAVRSSSVHRPLRVLFVGGDFRRKGGELLLKWCKSQRSNATEVDIVTREDVDLEGLPSVRIHHGLSSNAPELMSLYARADVFVLPTLGDCFSIAIIEAMASGLPVVASNVGGIAEMIEPGRNGFIVPLNDLPALGKAIASVLGDAERRQRMGAQSRLMAEERFDVQKNARRTLGYLKQIARQGPTPG